MHVFTPYPIENVSNFFKIDMPQLLVWDLYNRAKSLIESLANIEMGLDQ